MTIMTQEAIRDTLHRIDEICHDKMTGTEDYVLYVEMVRWLFRLLDAVGEQS